MSVVCFTYKGPSNKQGILKLSRNFLLENAHKDPLCPDPPCVCSSLTVELFSGGGEGGGLETGQ